MTTLASAIACKVFTTENFSIASNTLPRLRKPAVSIITYGLPLRVNGTSIASRVVPGISKAMTRSSPIKVLMKVDLPTFGLPTTAIRIGLSVLSSSSGSSGIPKASNASSIMARTPSPCAEDMAIGSPRPNS